MADQEQEARSAPYNVTWTTFINAIEKMDPATLPNRIDKSYLSSMSGGTQIYFMAAMRFFGLMDGSGRIETPLKEVVSATDPDQRRKRIGDLLNVRYPFSQLAAANATADELLEAIKKGFNSEGETARKQMSFYLQGCRWAGLPLSPHWPVGKPGGGAPAGRRRNGGTTRSKRAAKPAEPITLPNVGGENRRVTLGSGMTLTLTASMPLLALPADELGDVLELIKMFDKLAVEKGVSTD